MSKSQKRVEGVLPPLSGQTLPTHLFFYDTETYVTQNDNDTVSFDFRLGIVIYVKINKQCEVIKRDVHEIKDGTDFINFIYSKLSSKQKAYVYAHNQGFDLRVLDLFKLSYRMGFKSSVPIWQQMLFIWDMKRDKRTISFIDTANLGVQTVDKLGKDMGLYKGDVDFDNVTDDSLLEYCVRDVEILETFVLSYIRFIQSNNLGSLKTTIASQALTTFRTKFYKEDLWIHNSYGAIKLARDAYFGGRTECFKIGVQPEDNYYYTDINSMYPYSMVDMELPAKMEQIIRNPTEDDLLDYIDDYYCIADVTLETDKNYYPYRVDTTGTKYNTLHNPHNEDYPTFKTSKLIFPIGVFRTSLHHAELLKALDYAHIIKVHRLVIYEKGLPFNEYVKFFYDAKVKATKENNVTWRYVSKLFLNSLYGKFAQIKIQREKVEEPFMGNIYRRNNTDLVNDIRYATIHWYGSQVNEYRKGETSFSMPEISGAITSYARMHLLDFMELANMENVYYMDTDSLILNQKGYDNLSHILDDHKLGSLSLEKTANNLTIFGNKDYVFGEDVRMKGVPRNYNDLGENRFEYLQFMGFTTFVNSGGMLGMLGKKTIKTRKSSYDKGNIEDNGDVTPFLLSEYRG